MSQENVKLISRGSVIALTALAFAITATGIAASASAVDPCSRQLAALHRADTRSARAKARKLLVLCREQHPPPPIAIAPATPTPQEAVTVTIHPPSPLPRGEVYEISLTDAEGMPGDGFSHVVIDRTRTLTVRIAPREDPGGGSEWAKGLAVVEVRVGTAREFETETPSHTKTHELGKVFFSFTPAGDRARPPTVVIAALRLAAAGLRYRHGR